MIRRLAIVTALALTLSASLGACAPASGPKPTPSPPEGLTWMALSEINNVLNDPDDPTNHPPLIKTPPAGMIVAVDISHDGKPDWLMDFDKAGVGAFCGTGGCPRRLFVSTPDGYVRAFDQQALGLSIRKVGAETRIEAWVHDIFCDSGPAECRFAWTWDPAARRLTERPASDGKTILNGGGFSPLDEKPKDAISVIYDWANAERRVCPPEPGDDFEPREPVLTSITDINGDGLRDWLGVPSTPCDNARTPGFLVWASVDAETFRQVYESPPGVLPLLHIETSPASLSQRPACEQGKPCTAMPLVWDKARDRLTSGARQSGGRP